VVRAGACANSVRSLGVAGGSRTGLGDQSGWRDCPSAESIRTFSGIFVLAGIRRDMLEKAHPTAAEITALTIRAPVLAKGGVMWGEAFRVVRAISIGRRNWTRAFLAKRYCRMRQIVEATELLVSADFEDEFRSDPASAP
jgi:hypothetical protein